MKEVFIMQALRTPVGAFGGSLSGISAPRLGAEVIKALVTAAGIAPEQVAHVYMGNVLSANLGQAPARQATLFAGLPHSTEATTINKVCSSGLKAASLAALTIMAGKAPVMVAGGMESMSNVPYYSPQSRFTGNKLGHLALTDGLLKDGLWDVYHDYHMGNAAEHTVRQFQLTREEQDAYAISSYQKALDSISKGYFNDELVPVPLAANGAGAVAATDEDPAKVKFEKIPQLKPVFEAGGTITAANASNLNDGAAAVLLMNEQAVADTGIQPLARIIDFEDAAQAPALFTTAPAIAVQQLLSRNGLKTDDISLFEINEAYACVILANARLLGLPLEKINIRGGAVALGHPIGASGARILVTLVHALRSVGGRYGIAAICNGGGGATAMLIENITS